MRFFWPKMSKDAEQHVKNCGECITRKSPARAAPLHQITSKGPIDQVCIDFLSMEPDSKGMSNVLVVTDLFTRYAQAFPAKNQTAQMVAKILVDKYFVHYGLPAQIHDDDGSPEGTTPYHPQGDPVQPNLAVHAWHSEL